MRQARKDKMGNSEKLMSKIVQLLSSAEKINRFEKEYKSNEMLSIVLEEEDEIDKGQITILIEIKDVPYKEIKKIVSAISDMSTKMAYETIPDEIFKRVDQRNME
ncbi:hypothetical protein [Eubacterium maltosivorans]|nr:hypothetical protein [Eubacterium maltosivorans]